MTRNGLIVRARRAGENLCNLAEQEKAAGNVKGGWRLRHCGDALSTSSSLIACTVRFASRSPWKPAEKPIDSLFRETPLKENSFKNLSVLLSVPLLSHAESLSRLLTERRSFFHFRRRVPRGQEEVRGRAGGKRKRARSGERGCVVKRGLFR